MTTTVVKSIGTSSRNYSTVALWEAAIPTSMTQTRSNTTQAGSTSSTIVLDTGASAVNTDYVGHAIWCDARASQKRLITSYDGGTKTATIGALNGSSATWDDTPGTEAYTLDSVIWKGEMYNDSEFTETDTTIDGTTTDANNYVWLTTASGQSFMDHADKATNALKYDQTKGVGWNTTAGGNYVGALQVNELYTIIEKIQFKGAGANPSWYSSNGAFLSFEATTYANNLIVEHARAHYCLILGGAGRLVNSLVIKTVATGSAYDLVRAPYVSAGNRIANVTAVVPNGVSGTNYRAFTVAGGTTTNCTILNCAAFGAATAFNGTFNASSGYNATDAASAPGSNNQTSLTYADQFENYANATKDFRAKSTGSLDGNGTRDQTYTNDLDIVGQARSTTTPTIGAWEVVTGGGATFSQEGFRWRYDDGDEDGATFSAAQDEPSAASIGLTKRLRAIVDVSGNPGSPAAEQFELQYRRTGSPTEDWSKVQ